ncbi:MAG: response regulator [Proteobacteria bacterium]|nr:response regulator [Pseudomonadota bacterium]MCP4919754.1 response regulator [Pseudomonadota bacterium]
MRPTRILIVDDEELIGRALVRLLRHDCDVDSVSSVDMALEVLDDQDADVVLCDIKMSDQGGFELYEELVARNPEMARRMVFMTGDLCCESTRVFLETVPNERIEKPFSPQELEALVRRVRAA